MKKILLPIISIIISIFFVVVGVFWLYLKTTINTTINSDVITESPITTNTKNGEVYLNDPAVCEISFILSTLPTATPTTRPTATATVRPTATASPTITPSPTPTATATVRPTASPTPLPQCYQTCSSTIEGDDDCPDNLVCKLINSQYKCVNNTCPQSQTCTCPTATPIPTSTPTIKPSPSPSPTSKPGCYDRCSSDSECPTDLFCRSVNGSNKCININCSGDSDCNCNTTTPKEPELPKAGGIPPTVIFAFGGIIIVLLGLIF